MESKFSKVYNSVGSNSVCELKGLSEFGYPNQRPAGFRRVFYFGRQTLVLPSMSLKFKFKAVFEERVIFGFNLGSIKHY